MREKEKKEREDSLLVVFNGLVAVFTFFLALSSGYLWLETRRLRKISNQQGEDLKTSIALAKRASEVAIALELPIFVIENVTISKMKGTLTINLGNHGRTPAIISSHSLLTQIDQALPLEPTYPMASVIDEVSSRIVEKGHVYEISRDTHLSQDAWKSISERKTILWAYGYLEYIDFLKQRRQAGYCLAYEPNRYDNGGKWVLKGPPKYTYDQLVVC
ncbi:hypothetical protein [Dyella acidiphila]|uniref:Uncharacterized protein n=1 Tax=Dyella acidiphila TaxID=2775866 RepID=A0ABR9GAQ4_9GAMM|nr:hypothetical protein [Dyella acidiphila]MBE1161112.1 hypothetical protein [Dyella acidiphila]